MAEREFDQFFDRFFSLLDRAAAPAGLRGGLVGADAVTGGLPRGRAQGVRLPDTIQQAEVNLFGLTAAFDETGFAIRDVRQEGEQTAQGFADLAQSLVNVAAQSSLAGQAFVSIVGGGIAGGPLGALAGGLDVLTQALGRANQAARDASLGIGALAAGIAEREDQVFNALFNARQLFDPAGLRQDQQSIFDRLATALPPQDFDPTGPRTREIFDLLGRLDQFEQRRRDIERQGLDEDTEEQRIAAARELLPAEAQRLGVLVRGFQEAFGDIGFVELGDELLRNSDAFAELRRAAQGLTDAFETQRTNRLRFDAEEIRIRTQFARQFQAAGGDVFSQRAAFEAFERQRQALGLAEQQAAAQLERDQAVRRGLGRGAGAGRGIDSEALEEFNRHVETANRLLDIGQSGFNKHLETANRLLGPGEGIIFHLNGVNPLLDGLGIRLGEVNTLFAPFGTGIGDVTGNLSTLGTRLANLAQSLGGINFRGLTSALDDLQSRFDAFRLPVFEDRAGLGESPLERQFGNRPGGNRPGENPFDTSLTPNIPDQVVDVSITPNFILGPFEEELRATLAGVGSQVRSSYDLLYGGGLELPAIAARLGSPPVLVTGLTRETLFGSFAAIGGDITSAFERNFADFRLPTVEIEFPPIQFIGDTLSGRPPEPGQLPNQGFGITLEPRDILRVPTREAWQDYLRDPVQTIPATLIDQYQEGVEIVSLGITPNQLYTLPTQETWQTYLVDPIQNTPTVLIDQYQEGVTVVPLGITPNQLITVPSESGFSQHLSVITNRANSALSSVVGGISVPTRTIRLSDIITIVDDLDEEDGGGISGNPFL